MPENVMTDYVHYIVANVVGAVIFGVMLLHDFFSVDRQEKQIKFDHALIPFMVYFACDSFWAAMEGGVIPKNTVSAVIINFAVYLAMIFIVYLWLRYVFAVEEVPGREKPKFAFLTSLPFLLPTAAMIVVYFVAPHLLLNEAYELQPLYHVCLNAVAYAYLAAILIYSIRRAVKEQNPFERRRHLSIGLLPAMVVIGGIVQTVFCPNIPIFCYSAAILMLIFYIQSIQNQISVDPLTRLNNRGQLRRYLAQVVPMSKDGKPTCVIMFDINDFKNINDTYGHSEGDRALVLVADAMRKVAECQKMPLFLARYGGDEFIIVTHPNNPNEVERLVADIRREIEESCARKQLPYTISIGAGYDEIKHDCDTVQQCMQRADAKLYDDKARIKKNRHSA